MKTVFELKTLVKKRGLCGYSRLTRCELIQLLQREEVPMDIDLPSDWLKYDEYADSEFLVYFSDVNDDEYWKHRLQLKFGYKQLNVLHATFRQQFIKTRSSAVAERPRNASCLSIISFNISTARFLLPVTAASDLLVHKILLWLGYPMVKKFRFRRYFYSF